MMIGRGHQTARDAAHPERERKRVRERTRMKFFSGVFTVMWMKNTLPIGISGYITITTTTSALTNGQMIITNSKIDANNAG